MAANTEKSYQERILAVLIYIQNHLDDPLSLEKLASIAHFSPYHFHRVFSGLMGESVKNYLRRLRLERAIRDLAFTELSLIQISERAGYDTQASFQRAFKEAYKKTPLTLRKKARKNLVELRETIDTKKPFVEVKKIEPIKVAFVRHVGSYSNLTAAWLQLKTQVGMSHLLSEKTKKIGIPYDSVDITPTDKLRYDACVTLEGLEDFKPTGKVGVQTLQGGKYAIITHYGDIEKIESTYNILFSVWLPQSRYEPADAPNFILHRKIPYQTPMELLETDIYLPLK
ncbi:MAG TPA: GyrI-like domain-containing protein [Coxiellaceae bacterium]|nr:GyrI-like domain-containing protein [Coxiellaceae bacterium]